MPSDPLHPHVRYMLDTDTCSYALKQSSPRLLQHFYDAPAFSMCLSVITYGEMLYGAAISDSPRYTGATINAFLAPILIVPWDEEAARMYGKLRGELKRKGTPIGPLDTLIAAHALAHSLILVTNNTREFMRVPGLKLENWSQ